ncbi:hormone-sensitive lipase-like, partial [Passer montanus]|uniref:hormone-sensitive lipase-like n=1 Tax=Passer montanus TaxID=9160 RepID=UPI0019619B24
TPNPLQSLQLLARDTLSFFSPPPGAAAGTGAAGTTSRRFAAAFSALLRHGRHLGPALAHLARLAPGFDLDEATPGNGYRSLLEVVRICLERAVERSRHVAAHRRSLFFRAGANAAEVEAVAAALGQLRALVVLAAKMAAMAEPGCLFPDGEKVRKDLEEEEEEEEGEEGISEVVLREYSTMHNGCFYGRCLGFQMAAMAEPGCLFPDGEKVRKDLEEEEEEEEEEGEEGISEVVLREYSTMHNGCFYGRCLGFQ